LYSRKTLQIEKPPKTKKAVSDPIPCYYNTSKNKKSNVRTS